MASWAKGEGQGPASYLIQPSDGAIVAGVERMHGLLAKTWKGIFCMLSDRPGPSWQAFRDEY
eukprot:1602781-Alexandrium_andersonii.AAC.1